LPVSHRKSPDCELEEDPEGIEGADEGNSVGDSEDVVAKK